MSNLSLWVISNLSGPPVHRRGRLDAVVEVPTLNEVAGDHGSPNPTRAKAVGSGAPEKPKITTNNTHGASRRWSVMIMLLLKSSQMCCTMISVHISMTWDNLSLSLTFHEARGCARWSCHKWAPSPSPPPAQHLGIKKNKMKESKNAPHLRIK